MLINELVVRSLPCRNQIFLNTQLSSGIVIFVINVRPKLPDAETLNMQPNHTDINNAAFLWFQHKQ